MQHFLMIVYRKACNADYFQLPTCNGSTHGKETLKESFTFGVVLLPGVGDEKVDYSNLREGKRVAEASQ